MSSPSTGRALSEDAARPGKAGAWFATILLLIVALGFAIPLSMILIIRPFMARSWPTAWCTVEYSRVTPHQGTRGATFAVDVRYVYVVNGKSYHSNQYNFGGGGGFESARSVARDLNSRPLRPCYYDPANPALAVLDRSIGLFALILLIPLMLVAGSLRGMWRLSRGAALAAPSGNQSWTSGSEPQGSGPITLRPEATPFKTFSVLLLFDLIFGVSSVFLISQARQNYFVLVIGIPFALVSLLLILFTISQFLACFNPRPTLRLSASPLVIGQPGELRWSVSGQVKRLAKFSIILQGREEAMDDRRNNRLSVTEVFAEIPIVETTLPREMSLGKAMVCVPSGQMHSLSFKNNKIIWCLKVRGEIPRWPAISEQFDVQVDPPAVGRSAKI